MNTHRINPKTGRVVTAAGLEIGCAYERPAAHMGSQAEHIQSALLGGSFPRSRRVERRIERSVIHLDNSLVARAARFLKGLL